MKRNSKRTKKIRNLVLVCVLSALLLTVSTYAWFIGMQTVKVNSFEIEIASVDSLMLSMDGSTWTTSLDVTSEDTPVYDGHANQLLQGEGEGLSPISTIGEMDATSSRMKLYEKGSLTATKGGYRLMASQVANNNSENVSETGEYLEGDGYVAFDLFVMNLSGDAYYEDITTPSNEEAIYLTYDSAVTAGSTGNATSGIENSVRVSFAQIGRVSATEYGTLGEGDTEKLAVVTGMNCAGGGAVTGICRTGQIWEPNELTHVNAAKTWYEKACKKRTGSATAFEYAETDNACVSLDEYRATYAVAGEILADKFVDVYDGVYNGYTVDDTLLNPVDTFTDTEKLAIGADRNEFMTLAPNSITKVRVYIWIEGQDVDNYDFASLGNAIKVNFGFTKERFTTGEIDPSIEAPEGSEQLPKTQA